MNVDKMFINFYIPVCMFLLFISYGAVITFNTTLPLVNIIIPLTGILFILYGIRAIRLKKILFFAGQVGIGPYSRIYTGDEAMMVALLCFIIAIMFIWMSIVWGGIKFPWESF